MPISLAGIAAAAALMLFSLTGFESATVVANVTDNSTNTVPRATILGTGFTGLIYLAATVAALLLLPSAIAANSSAPFADAIAPILGNGAGAVVAIIAAISAFGTCNALLLLSRRSRPLARRRQRPAAPVPPHQCRRRADRIAAGRRRRSRRCWCSPVRPKASSRSTCSSPSSRPSPAWSSTPSAPPPRSSCKAMGGAAIVALLALLYALAMFVGAGLEATLWGLGLALAGLPIRYLSRRFSSAATSPAAAPAPAAPRE